MARSLSAVSPRTLLVLAGLCALTSASVTAGDPAPAAAPVAQDGDDEVVELPEVVVIGSLGEEGVPRVPLDAVGSRDVFGPQQVRETGARDVNDLLQNIPAVSTRPYNGGEAAAPSFSMRGLPDDGLTEYIHVLIDGVPASPMPYGWTAFSFLPITPDRIYAVDFIRGAHSVRYSPDTVGGVLNFITRPIPEQPTVEARSTFGDYSYSSNLVSAGATSGDFGYLVTYVDRAGDGFRDDGGFDQRDFNVKLAQQLGEGEYATVSLSYMDSVHKAPGGLTLAEYADDRFANTRPENQFRGSRAVADALWHKELGEDGWFEGFTYGSRTTRNLLAQRPQFPMPGDPLTLNDQDDDAWMAGVGLRAGATVSALGLDHELYGGLRYHREWLTDRTIETRPLAGGPSTLTLDEEFLLETYSAHIDDTIRPTEKLAITAGLRFEGVPTAEGESNLPGGFEYDDSYTAVLPGVGASYMLTPTWSLFANYFEGFRAPQVWGFSLTPDPSNAEIDFEEAQSWEIGTRTETSGGVTGAVTLWQNDYDNFLVFDTGFYENLGEARARGVDLEAEWAVGEAFEPLEGLTLIGSLTLQDVEQLSGPDAGNDVPYAWSSKAAWRLRYAFLGSWTASLGGTYVGESFSDPANTEAESADGTLGINPSRTLWDAQLAKRVWESEHGSFDLFAGATNLFDEEWFVHSRGGYFGGGKVAGAPRQAYFGVQLRVGF